MSTVRGEDHCDHKLTGQFSSSAQQRYYRCRANDWDIKCQQGLVHADRIEEKLGHLLMQLEMSDEWRTRALVAVDDLLNQKQLRERTAQIHEILERLDVRWDLGFINKEEYIKKRTELQQEVQGMEPLPRAMLEEALRIFRDFRKLWEEGDLYQRKHLLGLVLEKVWVKGDEISALTLRPSYHLVLSGLKKAVDDVDDKEKTIQKDNELSRWLSGSDGHPALITIWKLLAARPSLIATIPFKGYVRDYSMSLN